MNNKKGMSKKTKAYLLLASIAILALVGFGVKAAIDYKLIFWQEAGKAFGEAQAEKVDLDLVGGGEDLAVLGASATLAPSLSESLSTTTSTVYSMYVAYDAVIKSGTMFLKPDDGIFNEVYNAGTHAIGCATSSIASATSTPTIPFWHQTYSTSTANQKNTTSTFSAAWQSRVSAGEYIVCVDEIGSGAAGQSKQTPSSTGAIGFDLMPL